MTIARATPRWPGKLCDPLQAERADLQNGKAFYRPPSSGRREVARDDSNTDWVGIGPRRLRLQVQGREAGHHTPLPRRAVRIFRGQAVVTTAGVVRRALYCTHACTTTMHVMVIYAASTLRIILHLPSRTP